jgi:hypothetical protein
LKKDRTGKIDISSHKKCSAAIWMLAYGVVNDHVDENVIMSDSTCLEAMHIFCKAVVTAFSPEFLKGPNVVDIALLLAIGN